MFDIEFCNEGPVYCMAGNLLNMDTSEIMLSDFHFSIHPDADETFHFKVIANYLFLDNEQKEPYIFWEESGLSLSQIYSDIAQMLSQKELFV